MSHEATPTTCAVCGKTGALASYEGLAKALGWPHAFAHLACARYKVKSK